MESVRRTLPPNPREKANIISVLLFWWTIGIFKKGYKKVLELQDLCQPLSVDQSEKLGNRLDVKWRKQINGPGRPSLILAIVATFWREYLLLGLICAINDIFIRLAQPFLLGRLLTYFRHDSNMPYEEAVYYAVGIVGLNALNAIVVNQYYMGGFHNGMKVRVAVCSVIYRKTLRLSQTALGETALGKVVNLLSNDVNRFDLVSILIHSMWSAPLMSIIVGYLLWIESGWAGMIGIVVVFVVVPLQSYTGKLSSIFRLQTALRTDERVRFMDEIISGVQVIKMYAWEKPFAKLIAQARKMELNIVRKSSYVRGLYMTFLLFTTRMALFCTMLSIVLLYGSEQLTAAKVFVIAAYFNIVSTTMSQMFVRGVAEIAEALVAFRRLQNFLEYEEKDVCKLEYQKGTTNGLEMNGHQKDINRDMGNNAVLVKNVTARWISQSEVNKDKKKSKSNGVTSDKDENEVWQNPTLKCVDINFRKGKLIGIVGPVGAGKSSLLQVILRELPLESGDISVSGKVSYAAQEPWVFAGSARQNILFGQEMNRHRYDDVVRVCALIKDFEQLEFGDRTIIGEKGMSLSGGQKARVSLARAVYRDADVYLLDDPLSAVDAHVGRHLFNECIGPHGRLARKGATRILVTHQVHFLKEADWVVILRDGEVETQGTPNDLSKSGIDFASLLQSDEVVVEESEESAFTTGTRSRSSSRSSIKSSKSDTGSKSGDEKPVEALQQMEASSKGKVKGSVSGTYLTSGANYFVLAIVFILFLLTQALASVSDYWVSFWTSQEELRQFYSQSNSDPESNTSTAASSLLSTETLIYIHGGLMAGLFTIALCRSFSFYTICVRASQKLHDFMFNGIISTTMRFFDTNPSGRILNRFSKDMGAADEFLPKAILDASQIILSMFGAIIVTAVVNPFFLIPVAVLAVIFLYVRKVYLKTGKNIKRLEGITRSPVFTHLAASLGGLATIRAFGAEKILVDEFDGHQDIHSAAWYMFIVTSSAFGLSLDVMALVFVAVITFTLLAAGNGLMGGQVGLAITQAMSFTGMLQWGIRQSAEIANQLMSVERILEYRDLSPEVTPAKPQNLADHWPEKGKIELRNVVYRYFVEAEPVLKGLNFVVQPKEKIGIVGRTGAGKSSLIGALFRLAVVEGEILIDDVDTANVKLSTLRSKIAIIPQDPVLFSGTLRRNLDPFEEYPDSDIWKALEEVELKDIASGPLGLQSSVMAGGSNYSVGQRQLICLARAILRKNNILVLDEATANVDPHTDTLIQQTIRKKFENCSVLTVAHRLHTIMDSDRVLVMDAGKAVEFASPHELLQAKKGIFYEMVHTLGPQEVERLAKVAAEKFKSSH
ncbi:ATP-binding cassette sub-family C member 4 [Pseudolycoriella hygida]|uniref:ATP-binding cassette sub-family C member 4 n=1 Tax=Pseudolycoriella hygida TaxID=35572 RepID=A0A9Q0N2V0_9DIPT|nr:ATP-binding cassette sub-family C member 4 [Pseudolycoriella hygida]